MSKFKKQKPIVMAVQLHFLKKVVWCFVGEDCDAIHHDFLALAKNLNPSVSLLDSNRIFNQVKDSYLEDLESYRAACIFPADDPVTPYIWLRQWSPSLLVHEAVHAVAHVMKTCGLEDGEHGEIRAYLTEHLFEAFVNTAQADFRIAEKGITR
jgi:hypothetical protein